MLVGSCGHAVTEDEFDRITIWKNGDAISYEILCAECIEDLREEGLLVEE